MKSSGFICSIAQLIRVVRSAEIEICGAWFRGQSSTEWPLVPGAYRVDADDMLPDESSVTHDFRARARARHHDCPVSDDLGQWLTMMQHYGLPTRLLDWSESPLVALYFAVSGEYEEDANFFVLDAGALNEKEVKRNMILSPLEKTVQSLFKPAFGMRGGKSIVGITATEWDTRMLNQQTSFTVHGRDTPLERVRGSRSFLRRYVVPARHISRLAEDLDLLGLREATIFPDLEHLSVEIRNTEYV